MRKLCIDVLSHVGFLVVFLVLGAVYPLAAQNATGTITGTVLDKSGAAVAGAAISVVDVQTGIRHEAKTSGSGSYTVPLLPVGIYEVSADKPGFKTAKRGNIRLNITDVVRADLTLEVGSQSETVQVSAGDVRVNTENAEVSTTIPESLVSDLPLDGRNFQSLLLLDGTAYSVYGNTNATFRGASTLPDSTTLGVGGSRTTSSGYLIDGLNNRDMVYGAAILIPSIDAIQQIKMQTKTYSAQYGGAANQIQIHFKTGTNAFHGTAYEFLRNDFFDAIQFSTTKKKLQLRQHQYGYSLGGPVWIPKLYDGRDHTFFFANFEHFQRHQSSNVLIGVPSDAQWAGQFSSTIVDPYTGIPFPGNQIPQSRISQFATAYKKYVLPANFGPNLYSGSVPTPTEGNQQNYRFDQSLGSRGSLFFRYSTYSNDATSSAINGTGSYSTSTATTANHAYQGGYTHIFSPRLVNQVTFGYVYADFSLRAPTISLDDLSAFGINGGFHDQPTPEIPGVTLSGATPALSGLGVGSNYPQLDITDYYNGADTLTYIHGNHSITAGFSILNWKHLYGKGANLGAWAFNGQYSGDTFADFLLGNPSVINIDVPSPLAQTAADAVFTYPQYTWSTYVQDEWKASPRLSLSGGLRYEFYLPPREAQDRYDWFDFDVPGGALCTSSKSAADAVGQSGFLRYCGSSPNASPKLSFAPRLGFAYLPINGDDKTVIRGGVGIFYDYGDEADTVNASSNYPFLGLQAFLGTPRTNILSTTMAIPDITTLRPIQKSDLSRAYLGTSDWKRPYSENWSLSLDTSPLKNTAVEFGYQGSVGKHYPTRYALNQALPYDPANPTPYTARLPYPNFGAVYPQAFAIGSNYSAGKVTVRHNSNSLVLLASYVYSRSMDDKSATYTAASGAVSMPSDARNFDRDYGPSDFDLKHRFVGSFVYKLPFGRSQPFLGQSGRFVDAVIGGWQLNGVVTLRSGFPMSIYAADIQTLVNTPFPRANQVGNPYPSGFHKSRNEWFDITAFQQPARGIPGDSRRNILYAPGEENVDLSVMKNFHLSERVRFQFRAAAFNAFNHLNYWRPGQSVQTPSTFGKITSGLPARSMQFGAKLIF